MVHNIESLLGQIVVGSTVYYMSPEPEFAIRKSTVEKVIENISLKPISMNKVYVLANDQRMRWYQAYATRESANAALVEKLKSQLQMHKLQFENLRHIIDQEERSLKRINNQLFKNNDKTGKTMKIENLDKFLQEIGHAPLLSADQELELLKAIREKGSDCEEMEQLCQSNMRFVAALAAQYQNRGLKLEELIPIGIEGVKKAAMTYDLDSNIDFKKHTVSVMRQCLEEAVKEQIHNLVEQFAELQRKRFRFWMDDFENEDAGEIVSVERSELLVAEPAAEEKEILNQICNGVKEANTEDLNAFWYESKGSYGFSNDDIQPVLQELSDRGDVHATDALNNIDRLWEMVQKGDKDAALYLAHHYAYGDEEHGIFIDKKQAKELYDLAEWDDYDPNEESDDEYEVVESDYSLQGDPAELDKVEHDIRVLAEKYGVLDNGLGGMYVPFDILFKKLVGSSYYEGNITKMKRLAANSLLLHAESSASEPLLYALKRYYPQIEVNYSVDGNGFGEAEGIEIDE